MPDGPALVIPVRMEIEKSLASLKSIASASDKAGAAGKKAGKDMGDGFGSVEPQVNRAMDAITGMMTAQAAIGAYKSVIAGMSDEYKRQAEYVKAVAAEFVGLRRTLQEVATLRGESNTNEFVVSEAKKAAAFGMTPQERQGGQAEFLNFVGPMVGDKAGAKLTKDQAEEYSSRVGRFMKAGGYKPEEGMQLAGAILQQKTGPQKVDDLMEEFSKVANVTDKGQVKLSRAAPQIAELLAMGLDPVEAAQAFAIAAPAAPGQEGTAVQAAMRAITKMKVDGKEGQFGVNNNMSPYESLKAFGANMAERKKAFKDGGMSENAANTALAKVLGEAGVAERIEEQRGLIAGFGRMGTELKGFETFEKVAAGTPKDFESKRAEDYAGSAEGKQTQAEANYALTRAVKGEKFQDVELEKFRSKTELEGTNYDQETHYIENKVRTTLGWEDPKQQRINQMTLDRVRKQVRSAGVSDWDRYNKKTGFDSGSNEFSAQENVDKDIKANLEALVRLNQQMVNMAVKGESKPLPAAPPGGNNNGPGRMGN